MIHGAFVRRGAMPHALPLDREDCPAVINSGGLFVCLGNLSKVETGINSLTSRGKIPSLPADFTKVVHQS
jgi:hypothetical protein